MSQAVRILVGDVIEQLAALPEASVHCCVTSPPYWGLRDYGVDGQIGLEATPEEFIAKMVAVFAGVRRVLRDDGTLWLNMGDCYNGVGGPGKQDGGPIGPTAATAIASTVGRRVVGVKQKDLMMMPWRVALALQADGWYLRSVVCWAKKSPMPESVVDRPTSSWEPIFLMAKNARYFYDAEAVKEPASENTNPRVSQAAIRAIASERAAGANTTDAGKGADRKTHDADGMVKTNGSFQNAVCLPVSTRNQRNVWHLGPEPYPEAHFATFPTEIPRRAIKAGTSEKGCCAKCGAPWGRTASRESNGMDAVNVHERTGDTTRARMGKAKCPSGLVLASRTTGWEPGCACGGDAGVVPCTVLDPFLGSGTTVAVARQLGRHGVGIEINPKYVDLARDRIGRAERPGTYRTQRADVGGESGLFVAAAGAEAAGGAA